MNNYNVNAFNVGDKFYDAQHGALLPDYVGMFWYGQSIMETWFEGRERAYRCIAVKIGPNQFI